MWSLDIFDYFDYDDISELIEGAKSHKDRRGAELSELYSQAEGDSELSTNQDYKESVLVGIENDHYYLEESVKLSHRLAIVALYIKMELRIKAICRLAFPELDVTPLYRIHYLKNKLKHRRVKIKDLPSYVSFDELRCINNAIKHGGVVGDELAKYSGWSLGEELKELYASYIRLAPGCASFISELIDAIKKNHHRV
jgi:hypothetical protein